MSKELEALDIIKKHLTRYNDTDEVIGIDYKNELDIIETALERSETLEEENKFLRANNENLDETYFETWRVCEELKKDSNYALMFINNIYCLVDTKGNKLDVIDNYEINNYGIIDNGNQNKLKALEIIKEKKVNVGNLIHHIKNLNGIETYNFMWAGMPTKQLTQEEYELLKKVLL